jgi:1-carboxybiuret hydrolase
VLDGYFREWATAPARRAVDRAAAALGVTAVAEWEGAAMARAAAFVITAAEGGALHRARLAACYDAFEPLSRDRLVAGSLVPASWVVQAQRIRRRVYQEALQLFAQYDLLLAPATPVPATAVGTEWIDVNGTTLPCRASLGLLTQPISCIGLPVCVAPVWPGEAADGVTAALPIGVQLIAAPWREDICLAAAQALAAAHIAHCRFA